VDDLQPDAEDEITWMSMNVVSEGANE